MDRRAIAHGDFAALPDEVLCSLLGLLDARDIATMACVSSVFYVLCNEEPLWMRICLSNHEGPLVYKGSWKGTAIEKMGKYISADRRRLNFSGFSSLYLYRRWYRCNVSLVNFFLDTGAIERRRNLSNEEFVKNYDMRKPVLLTDLTEDWPARTTWTMSQLVHRYGDTQFKVSQSYGQSIRMKFGDYADYMIRQRDEDPLYVFDSSFGEAAPSLLEDYNVPELFKEDLFSVLNPVQRPPFRWLVIGPARSGANWHIDPALTSAWNTLLTGRKRWAFYPPGRVPPGVFVNVDEDDGQVHYDGPSSLQWWLDVYPTLENDCKPLECTQMPGETIFVPSGWWHCVLNIDETIAVTQNFVNIRNMELVCVDMAPGFHHRGIARAGLLALEDEEAEIPADSDNIFINPDFLKKFIGEHPDHFLSETNTDGVLNRRDFRDWLRKLQTARPDLKSQIWKCACLAVDAGTWLERVLCVCNAHNITTPKEDQRIPIGNGSSPVYLLDEYAIKLYVHEDGVRTALKEVDTELRLYELLNKSGSPLKDYVPTVVAKGIIIQEGDSYKPFPAANTTEVLCTGTSLLNEGENKALWPYLVTRRCEGQNLAHSRSMMTDKDYIDLASFLGRQLHYLHSLPVSVEDVKEELKEGGATWTCAVPREWRSFVSLLRRHRQTLMKRLRDWGSVPRHLLQQVENYVPADPVVLIGVCKVENGCAIPSRSPAPLHMDIMDDNIQMVPYKKNDDDKDNSEGRVMQARYIFDFGDVQLGDRLYELIPFYTDVLELNLPLLERFLESYGVPFGVEQMRTSYRAMCYCLLYKYDAMDTIFRLRKELRQVESWEELELALWGVLNEEQYQQPD